MRTRTMLSSLAACTLLLAAPDLAAQQAGGTQGGERREMNARSNDAKAGRQPLAAGQQAARTPARECLDTLRSFNARMDKDGFWLTGWGARWGYGVAPVDRRNPTTAVRSPSDTPPAGVTAAPWGRVQYGMNAPRYQIRTLHAAVGVLARRGDEQGCQAVLAELRQLYDGYITELRQAGVQPGEVASWRQERIVTARPVTEVTRGIISLSDVTGTEVRNATDRELGTISDVVVDPKTGALAYAIVERGGFLGFGEDFVAVPWKAFQATPGLSLFVLDVPNDVLASAPKVDPDAFADPASYAARRAEVDAYWREHLQG